MAIAERDRASVINRLVACAAIAGGLTYLSHISAAVPVGLMHFDADAASAKRLRDYTTRWEAMPLAAGKDPGLGPRMGLEDWFATRPGNTTPDDFVLPSELSAMESLNKWIDGSIPGAAEDFGGPLRIGVFAALVMGLAMGAREAGVLRREGGRWLLAGGFGAAGVLYALLATLVATGGMTGLSSRIVYYGTMGMILAYLSLTSCTSPRKGGLIGAAALVVSTAALDPPSVYHRALLGAAAFPVQAISSALDALAFLLPTVTFSIVQWGDDPVAGVSGGEQTRP